MTDIDNQVGMVYSAEQKIIGRKSSGLTIFGIPNIVSEYASRLRFSKNWQPKYVSGAPGTVYQ